MDFIALQVDGGRRFREDAANTAARKAALVVASRSFAKAAMLLLPAGFFTVASERDVIGLARTLHAEIGRAARPRVVAFGIDVSPSAKKSASSSENLFFGVVSERRAQQPRVLQQVSSDTSGRPLATSSPTFREQDRQLRVGRLRVAICMCGEIWSEAVRTDVHEGRPHIVVDLAHRSITTGDGPRSWERPLRKLARVAPVIIAEHTRTPSRRHAWGRRGYGGAWSDGANVGVWVCPTRITI